MTPEQEQEKQAKIQAETLAARKAAFERGAIAASAITRQAVKECSQAAADALELRKNNKVGNDDYEVILAHCLCTLAPHAIIDEPTFKTAFHAVWLGFPKSPSAALQEWLKDPKQSAVAVMTDKMMSLGK
jgi:hypothetical protein